ncbi:hypothetical protein [Oceanibacterium hippocampi]|uniref:Tat pathway signal sequence domain protein n=1 Tax=Oceanibacterium hippocampi TaxID=745714 RepID=A0A1Y5U0F3_9PROT|nr:hypothetical protein [Oceanibacterium hippocampi]SLN77721.1 hypothetical protein OCH7691_04521 [Oceanibacterium hippocampi]
MSRLIAFACTVLAVLGFTVPGTGAAAWAEDGKLGIELNKLEDTDGACRAYLVYQNGTQMDFSALKIDLVMFGSDGVINRRLAVDGAPLRAGKTSVRLFDIRGLACAEIARMLVNDVLECEQGGEAKGDCIDLVTTSSRASAVLER